MCENCNRIGPWQFIEKYVISKKKKKVFDEFIFLRKSIKILPNINKEWNKLKESAELIQNLPTDLYKNIINKFNFMVKKSIIVLFIVVI
jgi:hypothetical protein